MPTDGTGKPRGSKSRRRTPERIRPPTATKEEGISSRSGLPMNGRRFFVGWPCGSGSVGQLRLGGQSERLGEHRVIEGPIVADAVDEERRSAVHAAADAAHDVPLDSGEELAAPQGPDVSGPVQAEGLR